MLKRQKNGHLELMRKAPPAFPTVEEEIRPSKVGITSRNRVELSREE